MRDQLILIYSYLHGIWRYRWSALVISCVVALLGWVAVYAMPNQYTAQAVMHVDTKSVMTPLLEGLAVESDTNAGINILSRILLSRKNLEEVVRQTDMNLETGNSLMMSRQVEDLASSITLKEGNKGARKRNSTSNIYELSYQGSSAEIVYQVVSNLLNTLIETTLSSARTDTAAAQKFLDRQITEYEKRLVTAEQSLAAFKRANLGFMPDKSGGYYTRLQAEQGELEALRSELRLMKRKRSEMLKQLAGETPILDNTSYSAPKVLKLRNYREQLESLLTHYTEQHPDVQALRAIIAEVIADENVVQDESAYTGTGDSVEFNPVYHELKAEVHKVSVEVETLKIQLLEKEKSVEELKQSVDIIPDIEAKFAKLNRDYEITRARYLSMVERRESARLAQEVGQSGSNIHFQVIESPRVPTKPSGPNRLILLTMVLFAAISAGLGWGFLRYLIQPTFIDSSQLKNKLGLPVLGTVGLYLTVQHKSKRKIQLTAFLSVFLLLVASYGGVVVFSGPGSEVFAVLISSWKSTI
ncbi:MAG: Wzz/FepE/Etk N-terminal domain-containing protein [Gammaproteobacteria bacterium]|nr:Wzz/FepE/Etk N-terminal domain-containing protein [Gammaproteobacteria bacterium]